MMDVQSSTEMNSQSFKNIFSGVKDEMQKCIQECNQCHQVCMHMIQHCLNKGGAHAEPSHIRLLQDCAQICALSADFMIRGSERLEQTCGVCAEICLACAEDCDRLGDDAMMRDCADVCRRCADSCREMSSARH